jgi:hypothetical protein
MTTARLIDQLKAEGNFYKAGKLARKLNSPRYYGCHTGLRSTLATNRDDFFRGWDDEEFAIQNINNDDLITE